MKITAAIDSFLNWLLHLLGLGANEARQPEAEADPEGARVPGARVPSVETPPTPDPLQEAHAYLDRVQAKVHKLAADFNAGTINRAQFRSLYAHYQQQIQSVEGLIESAPASDDWKGAVTEGRSIVIRRQHGARARGYAIFENESGMPVSTLGEFELDPALFVPMLSSYRAAAREIFGAGTRLTGMEDGRWLCFVPGEFTTMLALFSAEPAGKQLQFLGELHRQFEEANRRCLTRPPLDPSRLIFPHEYYLGQWRR